MSDDIRRSGRANKGHHTKNAEALDEPVNAVKPKPSKQKSDKSDKNDKKRSQSAQSTAQNQEEEEDDAVIRCVCGDQRDIRGRQMICCDSCEVWQHNKCLNLPEGDYWEEKTYYCEQCRPQDHQDLIAAMNRGEKPWARKKGSKPKARPSDVKPEPTKEEVPTPQASKPAAAQQASEQSPAPAVSSPAPAKEPTPITVPLQPSHQVSNGHVDAKLKRETPKSQPQSPAGEKRRHESMADKGGSNKRRKSSTHQQETPTGPATDIDALPPKQKALVEKLMQTLADTINAATDSRGYRIPDGETPKSLATRFALQIIYFASVHFGNVTSPEAPFPVQVRSIMFNVKRNTVLVDRLLSGSLTAEALSSMSPEEMASEEKQKEYAKIREANEKQMVLTEEAGPRIRKTHKGEEIIGNDDDVTSAHEFKQPELRDREGEDVEKPMQSPSRDQAVVELPDNVGGRAPLAVDTAAQPPDSARRASTNFDINNIYSKIQSPHNDGHAVLQRRQSSIKVQEKPQQGPGDDADIDRMLKDEDNDVEMSGYPTDPTIVWQGALSMQSMEPFDAVARFVAGGDFGQVVPWDKLLAPKLPIGGRIESQRGNEYIQGLATSGSHDVGVLAISPVNAEARTVMDQLYNYFHPRDRWGVVPVENLDSDIMRDLYVIPIEPGGSNLPAFLDMLEYCTIETPRKERMLLLALVAKLPEQKPQLPPAQPLERHPEQHVATGQVPQPPVNGPPIGPSPSPVANPHAPQYSPMGPSFPIAHGHGPYPPQPHNGMVPQQPIPVPPHHRIPRALEILGPHIDAPVIAQILKTSIAPGGQPITEIQMGNLREIVEREPEARTDFSALMKHMAENQLLVSGNNSNNQQQPPPHQPQPNQV